VLLLRAPKQAKGAVRLGALHAKRKHCADIMHTFYYIVYILCRLHADYFVFLCPGPPRPACGRCKASESDSELDSDSISESDWPEPALRPEEPLSVLS
jgi:hypothetical protein